MKNDGPMWSVQHSTIKMYKSRSQVSGVESVELFINGLRDEAHAMNGRCLQSCLPQRPVHYPISVCCRQHHTSTALTYCSAISGWSRLSGRKACSVANDHSLLWQWSHCHCLGIRMDEIKAGGDECTNQHWFLQTGWVMMQLDKGGDRGKLEQ